MENLTDIGPECFTNGEVISYKGENYYKACDVLVAHDHEGGSKFCVKRVGHPGVLHEAYDGSVSTGLPLTVPPDKVKEIADNLYSTDKIVGRHSIADIASQHTPTETNEKGGRQSKIPVRFDLIDANAMFEMAKVLDTGARKYGEDNWRLISVNQHLNHLLMHTFAYLAGDRSDDHLSHILCRATFAQGVALSEGIGVAENH